MPFRLECAESFSSEDATEADIHRAFDNEGERGKYIILTAPNGDYIQAAGEGDGPYALEHRTAATDEHICAAADCTREEVRRAFLAFLRSDESWRASREWKPLAQGKGCLGMVLICTVLGAALLESIR